MNRRIKNIYFLMLGLNKLYCYIVIKDYKEYLGIKYEL